MIGQITARSDSGEQIPDGFREKAWKLTGSRVSWSESAPGPSAWFTDVQAFESLLRGIYFVQSV